MREPIEIYPHQFVAVPNDVLNINDVAAAVPSDDCRVLDPVPLRCKH